MIDLRNLTCPEPVLRTKRLFENSQDKNLEVLVDEEVSVKNLERLARYLKADFTATKNNDGYLIRLSQGAGKFVETSTSPTPHIKDETTTVVFIAKDMFGQGDEDFSRTLLNLFLQTLLESGQKIQAILMANTGVKLMDKASPSLKVLNDFREQGAEVLACGLCVDYYGLKDDIPNSQITNMFAICEYLGSASKVISP